MGAPGGGVPQLHTTPLPLQRDRLLGNSHCVLCRPRRGRFITQPGANRPGLGWYLTCQTSFCHLEKQARVLPHRVTEQTLPSRARLCQAKAL